MKPVKEIESEILAILNADMAGFVNPVKVNIVGLGPSFVVTFEDDSRLLSGSLTKETLDKTFPIVQQMWT